MNAFVAAVAVIVAIGFGAGGAAWYVADVVLQLGDGYATLALVLAFVAAVRVQIALFFYYF